MSRITVDPTLTEAPDFTAECYATVVQALAAAQGITEVEAAGSMTAAWTVGNDLKKAAWQTQLDADRVIEEVAQQARLDQAEKERQEREKVKQEEQKERDRKKPKLNAMTPSKQIDCVIKHQPSNFALKKLQDRDYVELCYFTPEFRLEASLNDHTIAEQAYTLAEVNSTLALQPMGAYSASKKAVPDEQLTWLQMTRAKTNLLECMVDAGWEPQYTQALAEFYLKIENHPRLQDQGGDAVLIAYQAQARRQWHKALKDVSGDAAFDISNISEALITNIDNKLIREASQTMLTRSVTPCYLQRQALSSSFLPTYSVHNNVRYVPLPAMMLCAALCDDAMCRSTR